MQNTHMARRVTLKGHEAIAAPIARVATSHHQVRSCEDLALEGRLEIQGFAVWDLREPDTKTSRAPHHEYAQ